jgi:hypothetical protein
MLKLGSTGQIQADQRISRRSKPQSRRTEIVFADFDLAFGGWYSEHAEEFRFHLSLQSPLSSNVGAKGAFANHA